MTAKAYRVWVYKSGATGASSSMVDFVLSGALQAPPSVLGPNPRPLEGRVEPRPWYVDVVDSSGTFTSHLGDGSGRMTMTNRLLQAQVATNGGAYSAIGTGRLTDVEMSTAVGAYRLSVSPETSLLDGNMIFSTNTTRLYPGGPHAQYGPFPPPPGAIAHCLQYYAGQGPKAFLFGLEWSYWPLTDLAVEAVRNDVKPNPYLGNLNGNFNFTRVRLSGSDYPIQSFGAFGVPYLPSLDPLYQFADTSLSFLYVWAIVNSSGQFSVGTNYSSAFLHMFSAPPSEATPLHIGQAIGVHPMALAKQLLDGSYPPASGQPRARYSTAAFFDGSTGVLARPMPPNWFRITGQQPMGQWIADHLWAPNQVIPFIDGQGRIAPRSIAMVDSTSKIGHTFTASNLRKPHPTFLVPQREQTTVLEVASVFEDAAQPIQTAPRSVMFDVTKVAWPSNTASDLIRSASVTSTVVSDRVNNFGRLVTKFQADGVRARTPSFYALGIQFSSNNPGSLGAYTNGLTHSVLNRFGDGPIFSQAYGMSDASTVQAGDWVSVTLPTYPNPRLNARGGTRYMQVMYRDDMPEGPAFYLLDGGAALPALASPSGTGALSTFAPKHVILYTMTALPTSAKVQLQAAVSTGASAPTSTSSLWKNQYTSANSTGKFTISKRPAGTKTYIRARATAPGRVPSAWSVTSGIQTSALAAPTGVASSSVKAGTATLKWTPGEATYPTRVYLDTSTSASLTASNALAVLSAGSKELPLRGLTPNTKHMGAVAHYDPYGGMSAAGKTTFTALSSGSSGNYKVAPAPHGGWISVGKV